MNATQTETKQAASGMKRNDHYSARTVRKMLGIGTAEIEEIKRGGVDYEGIRWCPTCMRFFSADFHIAAYVTNDGRVELGCADCAGGFGRAEE